MTCQGNTRLLMIVEWCTKQEGMPDTPLHVAKQYSVFIVVYRRIQGSR